MSRSELQKQIGFCKRELADLEAMKTSCHSCDRKRYNLNECIKYGPVPDEFLSNTDCPDWEFNSIPF